MCATQLRLAIAAELTLRNMGFAPTANIALKFSAQHEPGGTTCDNIYLMSMKYRTVVWVVKAEAGAMSQQDMIRITRPLEFEEVLEALCKRANRVVKLFSCSVLRSMNSHPRSLVHCARTWRIIERAWGSFHTRSSIRLERLQLHE
eukprot:5235024-Alexandrium_andersonii.AAC.1